MKKMCAVCKDTCQTNVIHRFKRDSDNKIFYICSMCREEHTFNADELIEKSCKSYATFYQPTKEELNSLTFYTPHRRRVLKH